MISFLQYLLEAEKAKEEIKTSKLERLVADELLATFNDKVKTSKQVKSPSGKNDFRQSDVLVELKTNEKFEVEVKESDGAQSSASSNDAIVLYLMYNYAQSKVELKAFSNKNVIDLAAASDELKNFFNAHGYSTTASGTNTKFTNTREKALEIFEPEIGSLNSICPILKSIVDSKESKYKEYFMINCNRFDHNDVEVIDNYIIMNMDAPSPSKQLAAMKKAFEKYRSRSIAAEDSYSIYADDDNVSFDMFLTTYYEKMTHVGCDIPYIAFKENPYVKYSCMYAFPQRTDPLNITADGTKHILTSSNLQCTCSMNMPKSMMLMRPISFALRNTIKLVNAENSYVIRSQQGWNEEKAEQEKQKEHEKDRELAYAFASEQPSIFKQKNLSTYMVKCHCRIGSNMNNLVRKDVKFLVNMVPDEKAAASKIIAFLKRVQTSKLTNVKDGMKTDEHLTFDKLVKADNDPTMLCIYGKIDEFVNNPNIKYACELVRAQYEEEYHFNY